MIVTAIVLSALSMCINGYVFYCDWRRGQRRRERELSL
jgi:hypothetical protein